MLVADDPRIASKSLEGLAKMMAVIVAVFEAAGLTMSVKKTQTLVAVRTFNQVLPTSPRVVEATNHRYMQTVKFLYLSDIFNANADIMPGIKRRI